MELIGTIITYIIMACCVVGGVSYIIDDQSELGQSFNDGLHAMANLFIPICGLMASVPFLTVFIPKYIGPIFNLVGTDPVLAAAFIMAPDCGSFALATEIGQTPDLFPLIIATGFMCASTISFNVPIGLSMLEKEDHKYLALGLKLFPNGMVKGFKVFGKIMTGALTAVVAACIVQHYTGLFTDILHIGWGFNPILADEEDTFRAIELLGTIAMMLTGAFPMVTLIRKYLNKPLEKLGRLAGLEASGSIGLVACLPNGLALFPFIKDMRPQDKVTCLAFLVRGGYCIGDFLAFNVNFQPNLLIPVFVGQVCGGTIGILFAKVLAVPQVNREAGQESAKI